MTLISVHKYQKGEKHPLLWTKSYFYSSTKLKANLYLLSSVFGLKYYPSTTGHVDTPLFYFFFPSPTSPSARPRAFPILKTSRVASSSHRCRHEASRRPLRLHPATRLVPPRNLAGLASHRVATPPPPLTHGASTAMAPARPQRWLPPRRHEALQLVTGAADPSSTEVALWRRRLPLAEFLLAAIPIGRSFKPHPLCQPRELWGQRRAEL